MPVVAICVCGAVRHDIVSPLISLRRKLILQNRCASSCHLGPVVLAIHTLAFWLSIFQIDEATFYR